MPVNPISVANEFVARYGDNNHIDHMKLQKLLYFSDGWYLALVGGLLLNERPQVWRYGPVYHGVYNVFKRFGHGPIRELVGANPFTNNDPPRLSADERRAVGTLLEWVWGEYGGRTGVELSDETHAPGTPWQRIAESSNYRVPLWTEIPAKEDWEYFARQAEKRGWNPAPLSASAAAR